MSRRGPQRQVLFVVASALLAGFVSVSCGVPLDSAPRPVNRTTTSTSVAPTDSSSHGPRVELFFVDGKGELVSRPVADPRAVDVRGAVEALLDAQPTPPLVTRIPVGTKLGDLTVSGDLVSLDLSSAISTIRGDAEKQAYAQIVLTVTAFPDYRRVRFLIDGVAVAVPTDDGNLETVTADSYLTLLSGG